MNIKPYPVACIRDLFLCVVHCPFRKSNLHINDFLINTYAEWRVKCWIIRMVTYATDLESLELQYLVILYTRSVNNNQNKMAIVPPVPS